MSSWHGFKQILVILLLCILPLVGLNVFVISSDNQKFVRLSNALSLTEAAGDYFVSSTNSQLLLLQTVVYNDTKDCGNIKCSLKYKETSLHMKNVMIPQIERLATLDMEPALQNLVKKAFQNFTFCELIRKRFPTMICGSGATAHFAGNLPSAFRGIRSVLDEAFQLATIYTTKGDKQALSDIYSNPRMKAFIGINVNGVLNDIVYYFIAIPAAKTIKKIYPFDAGQEEISRTASVGGLLAHDSRVAVFVGFQLLFAAAALWTLLFAVVPLLSRVAVFARVACLMLPYQLVMTNPLLSYKFND